MRYYSKYGVIYDLAEELPKVYRLSKVHIAFRTVGRGKSMREERADRLETYLYATKEIEI